MKEVQSELVFSELERNILNFWHEQNIFARSLDPFLPTTLTESSQPSRRESYVFYDGPPFATGLPHYGHLLAGTIKDVIGRFFTMKGFHVDRRFGWDCHGLPVEFEIQKSFDLHGAKAIREFGVDRFNEECRKIVLRYTKEWEKFVERSGRWVDFNRQYRTMDINYMESVWYVLKSLWDRGLVYEGRKCVPYSWAINTPLSNFEANLNYKMVQDPAVTVRARFRGDVAKHLGETALPDYPFVAYVWTTTPWTLPANMALAVGEDIDYSLVVDKTAQEIVIIASAVVEHYFPVLDEQHFVASCVKGKQLVGLGYSPFFPYFEAERAHNAFCVYPGKFVTNDEGSGLVHCASFGEEDVQLFQANNINIVDPVDENGDFTDVASDFSGLNIKEADPKIISYLKENKLLVSHKTIEHSYPFCWRTDTPLMHKAVSSWFVKVESLRDELLQMNAIVNWVPGHIKDGRFGMWLEGARDWAISRNRYWGTPIPIWSCEKCSETTCLGSVAELEKLTNSKVEDLHSHFIDHLTFDCGSCGATMRRVSGVLDCWFESGSMPYAQAHYPFESKEEFEANFPADFIAEGVDQTRGWFYTLLVLSTALLGRPAFKNVIVNGILLAEDGKKMSKSLKNYPPPDEVMEEFGADAMRLYLLSSSATRAEDLRFNKEGVRQVVRQTLLPLWNAYNFFVTYARVDDWSPEKIPEQPSPNLLDRWVLSKVASLIQGVDSALSSYRLYAATQPVLDFVDQLTNWYIRLNRRRFWAGDSKDEREDKLHAYATLHRALLSFVRVLAPQAPFMTEEIFLNLSADMTGMDVGSVHLMPFPTIEELGGAQINETLERSMELFEEVIVLGRGLRNAHSLKVRQPLSTLSVVHSEQDVLDELKALDTYIREELNIKSVEYTTEEDKFVTLKAQLNTKTLGKVLGPKLGSDGMRELRRQVEALTTQQILALEKGETLELRAVDIKVEDIIVRRSTKPGFTASASSGQITIVLDTVITRELKLEGLAREFVNRVQKLRKEREFDVQDRILVNFMTACPQLSVALEEHADYIMKEILAVEVNEVREREDLAPEGGLAQEMASAQEIGDRAIIIAIMQLQS